ncbi:MAG: hypothetical protein AUK55_14245 [Syntrophobacteraceae bacterium CG2_30_61_12]|nr:MAG: hypothetical protein AUK55_14245 [Syntrophobacteraceae bacterium CG2_30_61_12]PIU32379.1 MAG: hypothetical protein COT06_03065 [Syntrophobacteraceae bacterium CG07_land_8_20_14_0_80_61_8]
MCDLFAVSTAARYSAPTALPVFAAKARKNMDGWGIGFFKKKQAIVEKSAAWAYHEGRFHDSFQRLARVISSKIIIAHVRFQTSGPIDECHAHPFVLRYRGQDWIFAHNGKAPAVESYRGRRVQVAGAVSDSARTFEYLLDGLADRQAENQGIVPLFDALAATTRQLIGQYPGKYNYLLTNGWVMFAFTNHRQLVLLKGSRSLEQGLLLTTVAEGLSGENWVKVARRSGSDGVLMAIAGSDILLKRDL